ncbi:MAG: glutamate--cysteine ligase [Pseudomonadota bacterium]
MHKTLEALVEQLNQAQQGIAWSGIHRGIERETLRIKEDGTLAVSDHPVSLGKTLTHPTITTDYSENLLEFITPVATQIHDTLAQLRDIHRVAYRAIGDELLWPLSMPCYIGSDSDIRIAKYGNSHSGQMKTLYRKGLTNRYGATMQVISGVHYNFSVSEAMWQQLAQQQGCEDTAEFRSGKYFDLIRNFKRLSWVIPYLFGASPALCQSFFSQTGTEQKDSDWNFKRMGRGTAYLPYATSLRMSDLGYTNKEQASLGITYNSLQEYVQGLRKAITTRSQHFAEIGVKVDGEYQQLNDNILQIENEFYSPIRPKRTAIDGETPSQALERGGIEYIEIRALDCNPFSEVGISEQQIYFLDILLLHCLLQDSPAMSWPEQQHYDANFTRVVMEGRNPKLELWQQGQQRLMADWLEELFADFALLARSLDTYSDNPGFYRQNVNDLYQSVLNPELTLSGRIMTILQENDWDFSNLGMDLAHKYRTQMASEKLEYYQSDDFENWRTESEAAFSEREKQDNVVDFDTFLDNYFRQAKSSGLNR